MDQALPNSPVNSFGIQDYRTILESLAKATWSADANGQVVSDSPSWRAYTGQTREQWLNEGWLSAAHPDDRVSARQQWQDAVANRKQIDIDFRVGHPGGGWQWTNLRATPVLGSDGAVEKWLALNLDVTERKGGEVALRQQEARTRIAVEAAEMGTWEWNIAADHTHWNEQHFLLFGMEPRVEHTLHADDFLRHVHADDLERVKAELARAIQERVPYEAEFRAVRDDNQAVVWMRGYGRITAEFNGQATRMSGVMYDITRRKEAEIALREVDRRKDEFLAMLSHELRNPMVTIRYGLHALATTAEDQVTNSTLALMNNQTDHLVRLMDDLLDVSRISRGQIQLRKERLDLTALVGQAAEAVRPLYDELGRGLQLTLPPAPIYLEGDATRLLQVVTNLLTNGARYTGDGGQVWLSLTSQDQEAILLVRDNGIGIAEEQLLAIFELFMQVDNSLARSQGGLGLGLTLVKRLTEMHGGRVEAQSEGLGQGSTFTVHLPTLPPLPPVLPDLAGQAADPSAARCILVIDDNAFAATMLSMLLERKGYDVHTRHSGRAGLEAAESLNPAAILLDIGMPEMDGYETCRLIRQRPWGKNVVVIAVTGYGQEEDKRRSREAGFDEHLVKPVEIAKLLATLTDLLDKCRTAQQAN